MILDGQKRFWLGMYVSAHYDMKELFRVRTVAHIDAVVCGVPCNLAEIFQPDSKSVSSDCDERCAPVRG